MILEERVRATLKDAAKRLTGHRKRDFIAKVAEDYFDGSARKTETVLGWNRESVQLGLHERRCGIVCLDHYQARGRRKSESVHTQLAKDIHHLVEAQAQADPKLQSPFLHTRMSARAIRDALIHEKGYDETKLPSRQTISAVLDRLGYRLKNHKR